MIALPGSSVAETPPSRMTAKAKSGRAIPAVQRITFAVRTSSLRRASDVPRAAHPGRGRAARARRPPCALFPRPRFQARRSRRRRGGRLCLRRCSCTIQVRDSVFREDGRHHVRRRGVLEERVDVFVGRLARRDGRAHRNARGMPMIRIVEISSSSGASPAGTIGCCFVTASPAVDRSDRCRSTRSV